MKASPTREWTEVQRRCGLSDEALAMAQKLGLSPQALPKHLSAPGEAPNASVEAWVRRLHEEKFGPHRNPPDIAPRPTAGVEAAPPAAPAAGINPLEAAQQALFAKMKSGELDEDSFAGAMERLERDTPVSASETDGENRILLLRRDGFRRFAELFARIAAKLDLVERIVLFGSVAAPLKKEVPRFARFRRARIAVWHECKDVDLAIWVRDLTRLRELKRAVSEATNLWQTIAHRENLPGIPHHQVDVFVMEPGTDRYRGNLCIFGQCPKGKIECTVAGCGAQPFLQVYADFDFDPRAPFGEHAVTLFDRFSPDAKT